MSPEDRAIYERFKREGYGDSLPMLAELVQGGQFTWKRLAWIIMGPERPKDTGDGGGGQHGG